MARFTALALAAVLLLFAARSSHAEADPAFDTYLRNDTAGALKLYLPRAEQGDPFAMGMTALLYEATGDKTAAAPWVKKATDAGFRPFDFIQKVRETAEGGNVLSQYKMGLLYLSGEQGFRDPGAAMDWFRKAADRNYAPAQNQLGMLYGERKNDAAAAQASVQWYRKAAELGYAPAQFAIGVLYLVGASGVSKDYGAAMQWFRKAADQGFAMAQSGLATIYEAGLGVPKDQALAAEWLGKAAEQGDAGSQYELGVLYTKGAGVALSLTDAYLWLSLAAANANRGYQSQAEKLRQGLRSKLTAEQLADANNRIAAFKPRKQWDDPLALQQLPRTN